MFLIEHVTAVASGSSRNGGIRASYGLPITSIAFVN